MSLVHGVFFEANSIQQYILAGGRLRDVVGASYLIESLCTVVLDAVCSELGAPSDKGAVAQAQVRFTRRAAGAVYALFDDEQLAVNFAALWSLAVRAHCPLLGFNQAMASGESDFEALRIGTTSLSHARSLAVPELPLATPVTERAQRTGRAMVGLTRVRGGRVTEAADSALAARRGITEDAIAGMDKQLLQPLSHVAPYNQWKVVFPRHIEFADAVDEPEDPKAWEFPFIQDSRYLAMVHADANGLGQILLKVIEKAEELSKTSVDAGSGSGYASFLPELSQCIAKCTAEAAQHAIGTALMPAGVDAKSTDGKTTYWRLPARPIVVAGDDLTMLVRADLALGFTSAFIEKFEEKTKLTFEQLRANNTFGALAECLPQGRGLTACAGIVYARNNHPFSMLHEIAEHLCGEAKQAVKGLAAQGGAVGSAVAWRRITESLVGDERPFTLAGVSVQPRLGPVAVGGINGGLPSMEALEKLLAAVQADDPTPAGDAGPARDANPLSKGPLRRILNTAFMQPRDASADYARWRDVTGKSGSELSRKQLENFDCALAALAKSAGGTIMGELPAIEWRSPAPAAASGRLVLQELVDLIAVGHKSRKALTEAFRHMQPPGNPQA